MGDSENNTQQQPSKKRGALKQLSRDNPVLDEDEDEDDSTELESGGTFKKASDEVLATRKIVKVKRKEPPTATTTNNPFARIQLVPTTTTRPAPTTVVTNDTDSNKVDAKDPTDEETEKAKDKDDEQQTEKPGKDDKNEEEAEKNGTFSSFQQHSSSKNAFTGLASTEASGSSFSFGSTGSGSLFNFSDSSLFGKKSEGSSINSGFPPKQEVLTETGEENEKVAFSADSIMFEYIDGGWKERGKGEIKVNVSSSSNKGRLVMRGKGNYRLILNASLYPEMKLTSMDKKGITFACVNSVSDEGKEGMSTFALKFKDPSIVQEFRVAIDKHKDGKLKEVEEVVEGAAPPLKTPENSPTATDV